jgi:N-acyl-phosphatidylethanolamine-hydrolysing phospholipase D
MLADRRIRRRLPWRRTSLIALGAVAALAAEAPSIVASGRAEATSPEWLRSAPRTPDGRFTNPIGHLEHGSPGVRLPFMFRRLATVFRSGEGAPRLHAGSEAHFFAAGSQAATVTWIGHATVLVQMGGVTFLTDPIWSDRPSPIPGLGPARFVEPAVALEALPAIDFVLISHDHYDHLDLPTLERLADLNPDTRFYVPLGNGPLLREAGVEKVVELDWTGSIRHGDFSVHCLPAQHWGRRGLRDQHARLWSSWAVVTPERRFFYGGDTGYFPGFAEIGEKLGPFDLAALPIGAYAPRPMMKSSHMNPEEAWRAAQDLGAQRALGVHFGTFDLSDEPLDEPPRRFLEAAQSGGSSDAKAWILELGETRGF